MPDLPTLTPAQASRWARLGLDNVQREFPHLLQHMLNGPEDARPPRALHPAFYGSYDWHSCVHQHWMLVRLIRVFPDLPERPEMAAVLSRHLTKANLEAEAAYFGAANRGLFERPYGWAWLLKLDQELRSHYPVLAANLAPLVHVIREGFMAYFPTLTHPIRSGVHSNTAFAMAFALGWARATDDQDLKLLCTSRAASWFGHDRDYPGHLEPGGEDFISPALIEAGLMARILPQPVFVNWFDKFLPRLAEGEPRSLLVPAPVSNPADPKIGHLIGLNLNRAWVWRRLAGILPAGDPRIPVMQEAAQLHYAAALPLLSEDDYHRAHWLASFAVYALTE